MSSYGYCQSHTSLILAHQASLVPRLLPSFLSHTGNEATPILSHCRKVTQAYVTSLPAECSFDEYIIHELQIQISEPTWDPPNPRGEGSLSTLSVFEGTGMAQLEDSMLGRTCSRIH